MASLEILLQQKAPFLGGYILLVCCAVLPYNMQSTYGRGQAFTSSCFNYISMIDFCSN